MTTEFFKNSDWNSSQKKALTIRFLKNSHWNSGRSENSRWLQNSMIIPVRKVTNFANIIPMTHTVCTLYKQHLLFQTKAAMFKVQMNDKPNLALIKNEAQICKNCPLRLVTITAILITHLSTVVAWREKKFKHFVFYKYFSLVLGLLKSRISEKIN